MQETLEYPIDLRNISKRFERRAVRGGYSTLKSFFLNLFRSKKSVAPELRTEALTNITIRIPKGASVGIIGRNGAGKSTLLKVITGIYTADAGEVKVSGRVAALIELGAGFHPDFTGRENILLAGTMYGMTRRQIAAVTPDIIAFAELEKVIDEPVRTYSSGMFMRLGFAVAVHTDPDVLIVDEVLAVGDAAFVVKCKEKVSELRRKGKTLLLVSHDLNAVERWSDEVIWLRDGAVADRGEPRRVIDAYLQFIEKGEESQLVAKEASVSGESKLPATPAASNDGELTVKEDENARWGSREIEITEIDLLDSKGASHRLFHTGDIAKVRFHYRMRQPVSDLVFGVGLSRGDGLVVYGSNTDLEQLKLPTLSGEGVVEISIGALNLLEGNFHLDIAAHRSDGYPYDYHKRALTFAVRSKGGAVGVVALSVSWQFHSVQRSQIYSEQTSQIKSAKA